MSWTCHRLRAALVDFADGSIDERAGASVERHLAQCDDCSAAVLELREVPTELRRRLAAEAPEDFWTGQRASILHAIDCLAPASAPPPARERKFVRWTALGSLAAAAASSFLFVRLRSAPAPGSLPNVASRQAVNVATETARESSTSALVEAATSDPWAVDDGSLLSLADELESQAPVTSEEGLI